MKRVLALLALLGAPLATQAAMSFKEIVNGPIVQLGDMVITILYGLVFVFFLFGMLRFFFAGGEEGRSKGKQHMLWGIIILVVLFGVWAIVKVFLGVLTSWA